MGLHRGGGLAQGGTFGAGAKYLSYWLDLVSRWCSLLTSIGISEPVKVSKEYGPAFVASESGVIQPTSGVESGLARHPCLHWFDIRIRQYYT